MITSKKYGTTPKLIGPSFIALQVRDLEASKTFYVEQIGLTASLHNPPGAVVFNTKPVPFAIRRPVSDHDGTRKLGWRMSLCPGDGPFGRFFAFSDPDGYTITVHTEKPKQATATLDASSGYLTFINTFSVEPENVDRLVENLQKATEEIFRDQPGFISANLHVSRDRRKVVNYAQWRSKKDYAAMSKLPSIQAHMKAAAALATGFDPVDYDLRAVMLGESE